MRSRLCAVVIFATAIATPLRAELKYTMHLEAKPSSTPAAAPANPLTAMIGGIVVNTIAPAGGMDMTVTIGDRGARMEYPHAYMVIPAGGVALARPDGTMVVLDPAKRTYWRMAKPDMSMFAAAGGPKVTVTRTGEFGTVSGVRAERATIEIRLPLPLPAGVQAPAGIPTEIVMTGEAWLSQQFKSYAKAAASLVGSDVLGLDTIASEGFMMRSVLHGELLGDRELESVVTAIGETDVPASSFDIPAGYTETAVPAVSLPGPGN